MTIQFEFNSFLAVAPVAKDGAIVRRLTRALSCHPATFYKESTEAREMDNNAQVGSFPTREDGTVQVWQPPQDGSGEGAVKKIDKGIT